MSNNQPHLFSFFRCNGKSQCITPVNSTVFGGDPCPGTRKYVEVHYLCSNSEDIRAGLDGLNKDKTTSTSLPPWLFDNRAVDLWHEGDDDSDLDYDDREPPIRKPILVHPTTPAPARIPITTPKPIPTTSTRRSPTTTEVSEVIRKDQNRPEETLEHLENAKDYGKKKKTFFVTDIFFWRG